jgi:hypothetical protein
LDDNLVMSCSSGFTVRGLICEDRAYPGPGSSRIHTIQKSEVDTAATVTIADTDVVASISGLSILFTTTDTLTLKMTPVNTPAPVAIHWGLAAMVVITTPPGSEVPGSGGGAEGDPVVPLAGSYTRSFECIHADYKRTIPLSGSSLRSFSDLKGST